jgi:hydroxypyruvate reductase
MAFDPHAILRLVLDLRWGDKGFVRPHVASLAPTLAPRSVSVLAMGKAALPMLLETLESLEAQRAAHALAMLPPEHAPRLRDALSRRGSTAPPCDIYPCDHPFPTPRNLLASRAAESWLREIPQSHTLVALNSGGASAYLCSPAPGVTLDDLIAITRALQRVGATIRDLNTVRKHIETLKGGRLAQATGANCIHALIMSDVLADPLDVIASGPFAPDPTTFADALDVLDRFALRTIAPSVTAFLEAGARGAHPETPKHPADLARTVTSTIVASNALVVRDAAAALRGAGLAHVLTQTQVQGEARDVAAALLRDVRHAHAQLRAPVAFIYGGEWTVTVEPPSASSPATPPPTGLGGPSQELALAVLTLMHLSERIAVATLSTDGIDGPTDAAGAQVLPEHATRAHALGLNLHDALSRHDSHRALDSLGALHRTGPTATNLNHLALALAW